MSWKHTVAVSERDLSFTLSTNPDTHLLVSKIRVLEIESVCNWLGHEQSEDFGRWYTVYMACAGRFVESVSVDSSKIHGKEVLSLQPFFP